MARPRKGSDLSLSDIEKLIADKKGRVADLFKQLEEVEKRLSDIESSIGSETGNGAGVVRRRGPGRPPGSGGGRKRPKNDKSLTDVLEEVLRENGGPMRVPDIAEAAQKKGYTSSSANFKSLVNQTLIKADQFNSPSRGLYEVKK